MQNNQSEQGRGKNGAVARAPGIFILLISCGAACFFIVRPLMDMLNGKEEISYSTDGVLMTAMGLLFGLVFGVLGPNNLERLLGTPQRKGSGARWIIFIVLLFVVVFGCLWAWTSLVDTLGYGPAF